MMMIPFKWRPKPAPAVCLCTLILLVLLFAATPATPATPAEADAHRCKTNTTFKEKVVHFPVKWGLCVGCHQFENGARPFTLRKKIPDLCIGCHGMEVKDEAGRSQPSIRSLFEAAAKPPEEGGVRLHKPFADGNCTCCHNPHTSSNRRMLDRPYSTANYGNYSPERYMCFKCHQERAFAEPRTLDATRFRNGNLNLHYRHVNRDKGRSCRLCHEHHASTYDAMIRKEASFGTRVIPIKAYARTETGGSCSPTCHIPVKYDRLEPELNNIRVTPREGEDATAAELQQALTNAPPKANYPPKAKTPKPEEAKPEEAKPEEAKSEEAKPKEAKPKEAAPLL